MLATVIPDDDERGKAMGVVYGGLAVGNTGKFCTPFNYYNFMPTSFTCNTLVNIV